LIHVSKKSVCLKNQKKYFNYVEIGSINTTTGYIEPTYKKSIDISTDSVYQLQKDDILISTVRTYLGGIGIVNQKEQDFVASKALIVLRELKKDINKYYLFGILRTSFFIEQTNLILNASMYPRMDKDSFDKLKIPFPTTKNNPNPEQVENLVSLIVQNIIDKEEQIKLKNKQIDELIEKELRENQKAGSFSYSYPRISEIQNREFRLDTRAYERDFKALVFLTLNYKNNFSTIEELGFSIKRGQNLQISCIGESYYSDFSKKGFVPLITSTNINFSRQILNIRYIGNKKKLLGIQENDIMIAATGVNTGKTYIFPEKIKDAVSNINSFFLNNENKLISIFTGLFLSYLSNFDYCKKIGSQSNGGSILDKDVKRFEIPNFPESKQQEIAKLYYNPIEKNGELNIENYLEKEKARNCEVGIFHLNMEIFALREQLEDLVHKIAMEEQIELRFEY
jgi:restriction endonuclease S subunit